MSAGVFFHVNNPPEGVEPDFTVKREGTGRSAYDVLTVNAGADYVHLFASPEQMRELYDVLGAHLVAQETPAQAA